MKCLKSAALALIVLFAAAAGTASAQTALTPAEQAKVAYASAPKYPLFDTRALAVGIVIMGAAMGIGGLAKSAVESMARQPEVATQVNGAMIFAAALIEGATFFAIIIIYIMGASY